MVIVIIGGGPAGVQAALYTTRAGIDTIIFENGAGALERAEKIENYYGLSSSMSGEALYEAGLLQAKKVGATVKSEEVVSLEYGEPFKITTTSGEYFADAVIIATGASRNKPSFDGVDKLEGAGVSYCAVCDGFFHRGKDVAVLGAGRYALAEAQVLLPVASSVTILTNGEKPECDIPDEIKVFSDEIKELTGDTRLEKVVFKNGKSISVSGLFIALGTAGGAEIAKKIGAVTEGGNVYVDENMQTSVPGIFAAGDCTGGILQVAKAVHQGMQAGFSAIKYVKGKNK